MRLNRSDFGENFHWGVSTAAFQIEGAHDADGKGSSIWDEFTTSNKNIKDAHFSRTACDFYSNPNRDIDLINQMNIPNYRFSLSWPRIYPSGTRPVNPKGIAFYDRLIDSLLEKNIDPWVTLYHWDLPLELEMKGGWTNRDIVNWFSDYAAICARHFGDRVKNWMVMNEPSVFTGGGYFLGIHAPGKRGLTNFLKAMHHATLATASAGTVFRKELPGANIGTTFSCTHIEPNSQIRRDILAAERVDTLLNRAFIEPLLGLGYPTDDLPILNKINAFAHPDDAKNMAFDFDFIGLQCYTREIVKHSLFTPYMKAKLIPAAKRNVSFTEMGWEVFPDSMYRLLKKFSSYENIPRIIVTENGAAFQDVIVNGKIYDFDRERYIKDHIEQLHRAKTEGVDVNGYFVWTLTDNFEWAEGCRPKFGLVHVDFETQRRIVKNSGHWYADFLSR
ncbi:MAG: beta-glucosidase [Flavobacterium sp.]|uniref:GH1 family beta-glucosidase n=1 Tax=Flavobacterium sp. TaxID=239 RepID=UPI00120F6921|nr:GH1 family beta-glucosidase [Flavobacterium sp.]RZJ65867.1 MAG: beta-glucosidase [Flavobacterium sp.]